MKRIFVSSTFSDMQAERDLVQQRVLPTLRDEARKYGDTAGVIDLRWGVDTSKLEKEECEARILKVCLQEIENSHPYMLIFLGERYGTVMGADQIELSVRGKEEKYLTDDYVMSVTALEVEFGALSEKYGELEHCIFCFREPVAHMMSEDDRSLYLERSEEGARKLAELKERIRKALGDDDRLINYSCTWNPVARRLGNFSVNGQPLETVLIERFLDIFRKKWINYEKLRWQDREQYAFQALMESKLHSFAGREALLDEYYQSMMTGTAPIILQGEVGSGKTALLCKLADRLQREGKNVFTFFSGASGRSTTAESLLRQMVYYMENLLGIEEHFGEKDRSDAAADSETQLRLPAEKNPVSYDDWLCRLEELCYRMPTAEKVFFCIDALDQLLQDEHTEKLDFMVNGSTVQIIASCTDDFSLPVDILTSGAVKRIPPLDQSDVESVANRILKSYSRDPYQKIMQEILEKNSIGNPLYISLLIQRLIMIDMEELRWARAEDQIIALVAGNIREIPDELEDAAAFLIKVGIEKIGGNPEMLLQALWYLALSRNGLRIQDLQEIFAAKKQTLLTLDMSLLMRYLDTFFYVHEDGRIDFSHKVIRQGLLKLPELRGSRSELEEDVKEHLKTLPATDGVRMQEGMYFARIREDAAFARELIIQGNGRQPTLVNAIAREAVADGGTLYCDLIAGETAEESPLCDFFLHVLPEELGVAKEEMIAKLAIAKSVADCRKAAFDETGSGVCQGKLVVSYLGMGSALEHSGQFSDAHRYYIDVLVHVTELHQILGNTKTLSALIYVHQCLGKTWRWTSSEENGLKCYETALMYAEELHENQHNDETLQNLFTCYRNIGDLLRETGQEKIGLEYSKKALTRKEELYSKLGDDKNLRELVIICNDIGRVLQKLSLLNEAQPYFEKAKTYAEELHKRQRNDESLHILAVCNFGMSRILRKLGKWKEALTYCEDVLKQREELHKKQDSDLSLRELSVAFDEKGRILSTADRDSEALQCFDTSLKLAEELHSRQRSNSSLLGLHLSYRERGKVLLKMGKGDALSCHQISLQHAEELHKRQGSNASLSNLAIAYQDLGRAQQTRECLRSFETALKLKKELHEKQDNDTSLRGVISGYMDMGQALMQWKPKKSDDAREYTQTALTLAEKLYKKQDHYMNLRELTVSCYQMGMVYKVLGPQWKAPSYFEKARNHARELCKTGGNAESQILLSMIEGELQSVPREQPRDNPNLRGFKKKKK